MNSLKLITNIYSQIILEMFFIVRNFTAKIKPLISTINTYQNLFADYLSKESQDLQKPKELYNPIHYVLAIGGKRIRPILAMMAADSFTGSAQDALPVAASVEVFHNFTLVHDDIMDESSLRRGHNTVHKKWDKATAILSGDAMMIWAYQFLESYAPNIFKPLMTCFSKMAIRLCEGQRRDMDFETQPKVSYEEYIDMITAKTAVLIATSIQMGSIVGGANKSDSEALYDFGCYLGIAFQLQDDYLDTYGDESTFGKAIGGDILSGKKTALYTMALKNLNKSNSTEKLLNLYANTDITDKEKISQVRQLFDNAKINIALQEEVQRYTQMAFECLDKVSITNNRKQPLRDFAHKLMNRYV